MNVLSRAARLRPPFADSTIPSTNTRTSTTSAMGKSALRGLGKAALPSFALVRAGLAGDFVEVELTNSGKIRNLSKFIQSIRAATA
ncbi:hypothetical protein N7E02_23225 [Aliirhizobium terrae]|uniref:hypothetical protein n=1 Tax=Terrirhizobium terrae TaxID=2926709 RepID=UPI002576F59A|nr:hypothetical protein [Rhizobium sp. CC-CFT758]WJH39647.1 hypothetical protein N7E02_23225 [Rhizobium sp. CC-CFT758]